MAIEKKPSSWRTRRDRVTWMVIGAVLAFIVWTSLRPRRASGWDVASRLPAHVPTSLPLPTLLAVVVVILVVWRAAGGGRHGGRF